jgi:hypothetical protein
VQVFSSGFIHFPAWSQPAGFSVARVVIVEVATRRERAQTAVLFIPLSFASLAQAQTRLFER